MALFCFSSPAIATETDAAPVISNYRFGLICGPSDNRRVCFETNVIQVTNESRCVFNHALVACTWYGFSFDYDSKSDATINCEDTSDVPERNGNPSGVDSTPTTSFKYDLALKEGSHHFFIAKYTGGLRTADSEKQSTVECSFHGTQLFLTKAQFEFPENVPPVESVPDANHGPPPPSKGQSDPT